MVMIVDLTRMSTIKLDICGIKKPKANVTNPARKRVNVFLVNGWISSFIQMNINLIRLNKIKDSIEAIAAPSIPYKGINIKFITIIKKARIAIVSTLKR